jgi:hypothetical protein
MITVSLAGMDFTIEDGQCTAVTEDGELLASTWNDGWAFSLGRGELSLYDDRELAFAKHLQGRFPGMSLDLSKHDMTAEEDDGVTRY